MLDLKGNFGSKCGDYRLVFKQNCYSLTCEQLSRRKKIIWRGHFIGIICGSIKFNYNAKMSVAISEKIIRYISAKILFCSVLFFVLLHYFYMP